MTIQDLIQLDMLLQVRGITPGRAAALLPGVLAIISVIIGWWALTRSASDTRKRKIAAIISSVLSVVALVLTVMHLINTAGSRIGTGSGRLGAFVALVLSVTGIVLSGIALRSKKEPLTNGKQRS
jgi:hypothetical protein